MFAILKLLLLSISSHLNADQGFDVRRHLCTVTRYDVAKDIANTSAAAANNIPNGCTPIHINLVARHGTRSPNKKRMRELDELASHLGELIREAEEQNLSLEKVPSWLRGWKSPWRGKLKGGELISKGEEELYNLGIRIRLRFSELFDEKYHPDVYPIKATQDFKKKQEPAVDKLKEPVLDEITTALVSRYGLKFTRQDTATLWFLCKQEASVLDITDQACGLFSPSEVVLLEWADDLELFILKGYGNSINYRMGVPLLEDVVQSMEQAIKANEVMRRQGYGLHMQRQWSHLHASLDFFLKDLSSRKYKGKNLWNSLQNLLRVEIGGAALWHLLLEKIVAPHLKHDYDSVCTAKLEEPEQKPVSNKLSQLFRCLLSLQNDDTQSTGDEL
uniref:Multiple inositol polyphosphate phosphatase 1 n=1 Tax=Salix viminalis TaxID=40686 RepID=A0A6N2KEM7_SALVM